MNDKTVLAELEFSEEASDEDVHRVVEQLRSLDNVIVYESGFTGQYEVARQDD